MSLLTIVQAVARDTGFSPPSTVVGSSNETAVRILRALTKSGRQMLRDFEWEALINEATVTTDGNAAGAYDLPTDFQRFVNGTWWDATNQWPLRGPANAQQWQQLQNGIVTIGPRKFFRLRGNQILFYPVPSSGDTITYEYVQKNWIVLNSDSSEANEFASDSDTVLFDEELLILDCIWRFRQAQGLDYAEDYNDAQTEIRKAAGQSGGRPVLNMSGNPLGATGTNLGVNVNEGSWGI